MPANTARLPMDGQIIDAECFEGHGLPPRPAVETAPEPNLAAAIEPPFTRRELVAEVLHNLGKQWQFRVTLASPFILAARIALGASTPKEASIAALCIFSVLVMEFAGAYLHCSRINEIYRTPLRR